MRHKAPVLGIPAAVLAVTVTEFKNKLSEVCISNTGNVQSTFLMPPVFKCPTGCHYTQICLLFVYSGGLWDFLTVELVIRSLYD